MVERNKGHVVEVASMSSFVSVGRFSDYSAGKAALVSFSESESGEGAMRSLVMWSPFSAFTDDDFHHRHRLDPSK
jgi:short-subunit dehydrogenase